MPAPKIAVVSHALPPSSSGQAVVLTRLLRERDPDTYVQVSSRPAGSDEGTGESLPGRRYRTATIGGGRSAPARWAARVAIPVAFSLRVAQLAAIVRRERCDAIVACTGDLYDLPAAYAASRLAGVPLYAYVFDDYVHQWRTRARRRLAERVAPAIFGGSAGVIVPNEFLAESLRRRYGVEPTIVRNACDISSYAEQPPPVDGGTVVYTGAVYGAQARALRTVAVGIGMSGVPAAKLVLYTSAADDDIRAAGISGPLEVRPHLSLDHVSAAQRAADVLLLPLSSSSGYDRELVRTSAPAKMAEYLASRRPVLVHAPDDSFVASYFREHRCGVVLSTLDPAAVAETIRRLLDDEALRVRLAERAWERARADFDSRDARAAFERAVAA